MALYMGLYVTIVIIKTGQYFLCQDLEWKKSAQRHGWGAIESEDAGFDSSCFMVKWGKSIVREGDELMDQRISRNCQKLPVDATQ